MPPFKTGLLKRKAESLKSLPDRVAEDLIVGQLNADDDDTDSEHEQEQTSDHEQDEVLFDADSTLGEEVPSADASEESSDLTDSDDDDSPEEHESHSEEESASSGVDSGAESATTRTQSAIDSDNHPTSIERLSDAISTGTVSRLQPVGARDEYSDGDTSDEEDRRSTVGSVPMWWYQEYPHVGYDLDGRRVLKPPQRDHIEEFLKKCEDPEFWRTVRDPSTGQDVVLSTADLELISRLRQGHVPDPEHDPYKPWVEWFSREVLAAPVRAFPEHKRSFLPSRHEQRQVSRLVHALRMGWAKTRRQLADERRQRKERKFYNLWGSDGSAEDRTRGIHKHIPAPRRPLPTHAESYNPPPEYLLDDKELKEWLALAETPWRRKHSVLPTAHAALRHVAAYPRYSRERFLRCLDLYLAPRAVKMRLTISPDALVPALPAPRALQPFPTAEALLLRGHSAPVRAVDFDCSGQYAVSGADDHTLRVWEISTGRCLRTVQLDEPVTRVAWAPVAGLSLVAAALGRRLLLLNPGHDVGAARAARHTDELLEEPPPGHDKQVEARVAAAAEWLRVSPEQWARGVRLGVTHFRAVTHVAWHARGDYVCATVADGAARALVVHQVSRRASQLPLARSPGLVQCALFHPTRPQLFVATQRAVRVYDLVRQELVRKLQAPAQWISHMALHPRGDNLLVASYDRKLMWFDLELSAKPYQTLRLHGGAVRSVAFHSRYPLFASAGDDDVIVVTHAMVYNDLLQNPLLVPLKQLRAGGRGAGGAAHLCVLDVRWHPSQPWLLAAGADHHIRLYT